jgi:hypothetical protein
MSDNKWGKVGEWLKTNAGTGAALVGSLLTGNVPGAVAAGVALVTSATGVGDPDQVMAQLQNNPECVVKLKELAYQNEANIRAHIESIERIKLEREQAQLADQQASHATTQATIQQGDQALDEYVRRTRPQMARQSWYATIAYVFVFELMKAVGVFDFGASMELALLLLGPAGVYLGLRSVDRHTENKFAALGGGNQ